MHHYGIPIFSRSMIAYKILTEYGRIFRFKIAWWECYQQALLAILENRTKYCAMQHSKWLEIVNLYYLVLWFCGIQFLLGSSSIHVIRLLALSITYINHICIVGSKNIINSLKNCPCNENNGNLK